MKPLIWTALAAALLSAVATRLLVVHTRRQIEALELRRSELETRKAPLAAVEARVIAYRDLKGAVEINRAILQAKHTVQAATPALLRALLAAHDPTTTRISVRPDGGTIEGHAPTPVAAVTLAERLEAEGLVASFTLNAFSGDRYAVSFTLPHSSESTR